MKRPPEQRRKLPPHLEAFARSDEEKLRVRRPRTDRGQVRDPREGYTVAGVSNRDARAVYDVRVRAMRALWNDGQADERALNQLGQLFLDALRLELWDARRLTGFAAFAEEVIGVQVGRAEALAEAASARTGESTTPLTERATALWLRTEAGLYEGDEGARARIRSTEQGPVLEIVVALGECSTALAGVGARHLPLARTRDEREEREEERPRHDRREERARPERAPVEPSFDAEEELEELLAEERTEQQPDESHDEAFAEPMEEAGVAEHGDELDEDEPVTAPSGPSGGVKLLTRKQPREQAWQPEERPQFGQRPERSQFGQRPERSQFGQRDERPRGDRGPDRPRFGSDRPRFNNDRAQGNERPRSGGPDRPRFHNDRAQGAERPRFGGPDRPRFNNDRGQERPRFHNDRAQGAERPRFGGNDRPRFNNDRGQERPRFGGNDRPRFGNDRPQGNDRPRFGKDRPGSNDRGRGPVDRSQSKPKGKFGGAKPGKFGGAKHGGKGFGARQSFGQSQPQNRKPRDDDFDE